MKCYAAYYDHEIRKHSSSGGIFSLIAGRYEIVYGVAMSEDCHSAEFRRITGDILPLRGSKYLQAKVGGTYKQVKQDLETGRTVLFTGTGCQINGLKLFLQKEYENLLTMDVICHGVPSPKLWDIYASFREAEFGSQLENVNFRCKDRGWADFGMKEKLLYISKDKDPFMQMFLRDYCLRPSCYECHAKSMKLSDLSIADFWGVENVASEMNDGMGTSLVITRTEKGQTVLESVKAELKWKEVCYEDAVRFNSAEFRSTERPQKRDSFFHDLSSLTFAEMAKKYAGPPDIAMTIRVKRKIKHVIRKIVGCKRGDKERTSNSHYGLLFTFSNRI